MHTLKIILYILSFYAGTASASSVTCMRIAHRAVPEFATGYGQYGSRAGWLNSFCQNPELDNLESKLSDMTEESNRLAQSTPTYYQILDNVNKELTRQRELQKEWAAITSKCQTDIPSKLKCADLELILPEKLTANILSLSTLESELLSISFCNPDITPASFFGQTAKYKSSRAFDTCNKLVQILRSKKLRATKLLNKLLGQTK